MHNFEPVNTSALVLPKSSIAGLPANQGSSDSEPHDVYSVTCIERTSIKPHRNFNHIERWVCFLRAYSADLRAQSFELVSDSRGQVEAVVANEL
jgi:hypothetical protein